MRMTAGVTVLLAALILWPIQASAENIPNEVLARIKNRITNENPGEYYLQKILVDAEVKSWLELQHNYTDVPDSVFFEIRDRKARENPDQYYLQKILVDADAKAWKELNQ